MYVVIMAWVYVALMMGVAEATSPNGTVLGAVITVALYGALPLSLVVYIMGTPARKRAIRMRETLQREGAAPPQSALEPDTDSHSPANAIAPVREES